MRYGKNGHISAVILNKKRQTPFIYGVNWYIVDAKRKQSALFILSINRIVLSNDALRIRAKRVSSFISIEVYFAIIYHLLGAGSHEHTNTPNEAEAIKGSLEIYKWWFQIIDTANSEQLLFSDR